MGERGQACYMEQSDPPLLIYSKMSPHQNTQRPAATTSMTFVIQRHKLTTHNRDMPQNVSYWIRGENPYNNTFGAFVVVDILDKNREERNNVLMLISN